MANIQQNVMQDVPGAHALVEWFGEWPSFHDAEVLSLDLNRDRISTVRVWTWKGTGEVDSDGFFVRRKHVIVSFQLDGLTDIQLDGFNAQNVISSLDLSRSEDGFVLSLSPCYGVAGTLTAEQIRVEFQPGRPEGSESV